MQSPLQDVKLAARLLAKHRGVSGVAVLTLALGIGANTAIFSVVKGVLLNPLPYRHAERLVSVAQADPGTPRPITVDFTTTADWRERSRSFQHLALYRDWSSANVGDVETELIRGLRVGWDFFDALGVTMQLGRSFRPEEDAPDRGNVVVLSQGLWRRRFGGDPAIVGRTVQLNGAAFMVVGVLPAGFRPIEGSGPEMYAPLTYALGQPNACRGCQHLRLVGLLKPGVGVRQASDDLNGVMRQVVSEHPTRYDSKASVIVQPLVQRIVGATRAPLYVLFGAVGFVLLIACANVANLLLARAAGRGREIALRAALGASRPRLVLQLLTESLMLALLGGAGGLLLARAGIGLLVAAAPREIPRLAEITIDLPVLGFGLGVTLATGLLFGILPALRASRVDLNEALKDAGRATGAGSRHGLRSALVACELALAFVLVVGTALLGKSLLRLVHVDPGFDARNVQTMSVYLWGQRYQQPDAELDFYRQLGERLRALPGVESVAMVSTVPFNGFDRRGFHIQDRPLANPSEAPSLDHYSVSPDYFRLMRIPLKRGRLFGDADVAASQRVALISESAARTLFPDRDPIGRQAQFGGRDEKRPWATIVGVVGDVRQYALDRDATPQSYIPQAQDLSYGYSLFVRTTGPAPSLERDVRAALQEIDKTQPAPRVAPLDGFVSASLAQRRFTLGLLLGFGALGLLMAAVGTYGVVSYTVSLRIREVGIRMALGAQARDVLAMVLRQGATLAGIGLATGWLASLLLTRFLASLLFEVHPMDPATSLAVAGLLLGVVLAATWLPARRATRVDPLTALRHE